MDMRDVILSFPKQFEYQPEVINGEKLGGFNKFIIIGMGGSHLSAGLLKIYKPNLDITIHKNYGLPNLADDVLKDSLIILSSYSGETQEILDALAVARKRDFSVAVVTTGGELLRIAKENSLPYIKMPNTGIQPRNALGYSFVAILKLVGDDNIKVGELAKTLDSSTLEDRGKKLASEMKDFIPVIYSSTKNGSLANNWKIKFNETSKVPAFYNVFPELNHNGMEGFSEPSKFYFIFLKDKDDDPRILKRMEILESILVKKDFFVKVINLEGVIKLEKIFSNLIMADWVAYYMAINCNKDPEHVPIIEEFKKLI